MNQLPSAQRQLLRAIELEGVTQKDFAEQHDIKYSTLKSRVKKARASLMAQFDNCCSFSVDSRGSVIDFSRKGKSCGFAGHEAK
ncbi:sigma factor-like helix-turn-helix DNA-binding protein [Psychrobium sp. nBUS_13]|uniref:sigma factor-like helix-turn-helix DNA-binding protein n=1 Tax=Psychrobium sp. nBUS_13 TaxID=3395319 RepID=UPI003EB94D81